MAKENEPTIKELNAGHEFRDSVVHKANGGIEQGKGVRNCPFWFGWVIMDAFLAGIEYEKKKK